MEKVIYNTVYYKNNYVDQFYVKFGIANLYYIWLAIFCIIIPARLKKGSRVLDVGCGIGNLVWALRLLGIDAYGIEPSISAKIYCRVPKYCTYRQYQRLPFEKNSFDLVYTSEVLEHILERRIDESLTDMSRISNGKMIHMVGVKERGKMVTDDPTHITIHDEKWWEQKFLNLGFLVTRGNPFYFFPHIFPPKINPTKIKKGYFLLHSEK